MKPEKEQFLSGDSINPTQTMLQNGRFLEFNLGGRLYIDGTTYNPSVPFYDIHDGKMSELIMVRHESLPSESDSEVVICDYQSRQIVDNAPIFALSQDPYYLGKFRDANNEFWQMIGMVRISVDSNGRVDGWQDALYRYKDSVMELGEGENTVEPWLLGMPKWKDLRFLQLENGILVTPRPQGGEFGGLGRVGQFMTGNLDTLSNDLERFASEQDENTIIKGLFRDGHWGAINQLIGRHPGTNYIKAVGHDAYTGEDGLRHYSATYFWFDSESSTVVGDIITIATADNFVNYSQKPGHGLGKVVFSAGIRVAEVEDGTSNCRLYTGVGDKTVGEIEMDKAELDKRILQSIG